MFEIFILILCLVCIYKYREDLYGFFNLFGSMFCSSGFCSSLSYIFFGGCY